MNDIVSEMGREECVDLLILMTLIDNNDHTTAGGLSHKISTRVQARE